MMLFEIPVILDKPSSASQIVICCECAGTGSVFESCFPESYDNTVKICPLCEGARVLYRTETVVYKRLPDTAINHL